MPDTTPDTQDPERPRLVIDITDRTHIALEELQRRYGDNKTTSCNAAVKLYAELRALDDAGGMILIKQPGASGWEQLRWAPRADAPPTDA